MLGSGEDLNWKGQLVSKSVRQHPRGTNLVAAGVFASMHTLSLLRFADAMRSWSVGDRERDLRLSSASTHCSSLSACLVYLKVL